MRRVAALFLLLPLFLLLSPAQVRAGGPEWKVREDWAKVFERSGVRGTMLVYDERSNMLLVHDPERAKRGFIPASTFKLFNALVALEEKAVADEHEVLRWDGVERALPDWNRDQTLGGSMKFSTVWFHKEMARRVGAERMRHWLAASGYGNADANGGVDRFWLDGALRISAEQQVGFLRQLADGRLPFSAATQESVRRIALIEDGVGYHLHGKTGWGGTGSGVDGAGIGWWVGWVERGAQRWFFAINIDIRKDADGEKRKRIGREILALEGALPKAG